MGRRGGGRREEGGGRREGGKKEEGRVRTSESRKGRGGYDACAMRGHSEGVAPC